VKYLSGAPLYSRLLTLPAIIRNKGTNTLAYFAAAVVEEQRKFEKI
jgi:hypothetical protein